MPDYLEGSGEPKDEQKRMLSQVVGKEYQFGNCVPLHHGLPLFSGGSLAS